jgi:hypothetical protein
MAPEQRGVSAGTTVSGSRSMTLGPTDRDRLGRWKVVLLGGGFLLVAAALGWLGWLLWRDVPLHVALFAAFDTPLPRSTVLVVTASTWFIRLLPLLLLSGLGLAALILVRFLAGGRARRERDARALIITLWIGGLAALGACSFVLHGLHAGCNIVSGDQRYQAELKGFHASGDFPCSATPAL